MSDGAIPAAATRKENRDMSQQEPKKPQLPLKRSDQDRNKQQGQNPKGGGQNSSPERRTPKIPTWVVASLIIALIGWYIWALFINDFHNALDWSLGAPQWAPRQGPP